MKSWLLLSVFFGSAAYGLPTGMQVDRETAELFSDRLGHLSISAADRSILHWSDFSISQGEEVLFLLPDASSWVLNRVSLGSSPSCIDGSLTSNGQVLLINPNGVIIGREGSIQMESFIASTLDMQNQIFIGNKRWTFDGTSEASIVHSGKIAVQRDLILSAETIDASGSLSANGGTLALVSASNYSFSPGKSGGLETGPWAEKSFVKLSSLIDNPGGSISLLGRTIFVDEAQLDASGNGSIAIGGGFSLFPAEQTVVAHGSLLAANALENGDGGPIFVWSDKRTVFAGKAESMGGHRAGNGGMIEVSGGHVDFRGLVDTRAPFGLTGHFILDPLDIEIVPGAVDTNVTVLAAGTIYEPNASPSSVSQTTLNMALGSSNVLVRSLGGAGPDPGNIFLVTDYPILPVPLSSNTLTLDAFNNILINASLRYLGPNSGSLVLNALSGRIVVGNALPGQTTNAIVGTSGGTITMTARTVIVQGNAAGPYFAQVNATDNSSISITATAGDVRVLAANGNGAFAQIGSDDLAGMFFSNIFINAAQNVLVQGATATDSYAVIGHGASPVIKPDTLTGDIFVTAGGNVNVTGGLSATQNGFAVIGHLGGSSAIPVNCVGNVTVNAGGFVALQGGNLQSFARIGHGSLFYNNATISGSVDVSAIGPVTLTSGTNNSMTHIGHFSLGGGGSVGPTTITSALVRVNSNTSITLTPNLVNSAAIIGGRTNGGGAASSVNIANVSITTPGNLLINPSIDSVGFIGLNAGTNNAADGSLAINIGGDLIINNLGGVAGDAITNRAFLGGVSNPAGTVTIDARNIFITVDTSPAGIASSGPLTVRVLQDIQFTGSAPGAGIFMAGVNGTDIDAGRNIVISSQVTSASGTTGIGGGAFMPMNLSGRVHAGNDIILLDTSGGATNFSSYIASTGTGTFDVIAGRNIQVANRGLLGAVDQLNVVVDDNFPSPPQIGPGSFQLAAGGTVRLTAIDNLRIFTARQNQNSILGTLISGGTPTGFTPGPLYANVPPELWGVYFFDPFFYTGQIFTIFYKDSLQAAAQQATIVIDESLVDFHPYNEFPGWIEEFSFTMDIYQEKFILRRRHLKVINQPKSWTVWLY